MRVSVYNKQQYPVGRAGFTFPPGETTEIEASGKPLAEIRACVYLKVTPIDEALPASEPGDIADLNKLRVAELRELAAGLGVDIPTGAKRDTIVDLLNTEMARSDAGDTSNDDETAA